MAAGFGLVRRYRRGAHAIVGWAILAFAMFWTATASLGVGSQCYRCARGLTPASTRVVEGPVRDFVPMPYTGHQLERFTVNDVRFAYSDFETTCGFHNTASHGGPIGAGRLVRIHHDSNLILKLEVAR